MKIHSQIEEETLYPAFHEAAGKEEHHVVDMVMPEVSRESEGGAEGFAARAKVLKDLIEHHADEEEKQMFPKAKKLMGRDELREPGRLEERKQELGAK